MGEATNLPATISEMRTGGIIRPVVPQSMEDAYRLAKAVCISGLAPKGLNTPEAAMVAILHGLEIGLPPMMALQKIAVINGRPTLWGDGALGLVRSSGKCKYVKETMSGTGDARIAHCVTHRSDEPEPIERSFSVSDAKKAGLWGKAGPWQQFPERMLQMRARAFALRDGYADVLGGMYLAEELQGTDTNVPPAPMAQVLPAPQPKAKALMPPPAPKVAEPEPALTEDEERALDRRTMAEMHGGPAMIDASEPEEEPTPAPRDSLAEWVSDKVKESLTMKTQSELDLLDDMVVLEVDSARREDLRTVWNAAYGARKAAFKAKK